MLDLFTYGAYGVITATIAGLSFYAHKHGLGESK